MKKLNNLLISKNNINFLADNFDIRLLAFLFLFSMVSIGKSFAQSNILTFSFENNLTPGTNLVSGSFSDIGTTIHGYFDGISNSCGSTESTQKAYSRQGWNAGDSYEISLNASGWSNLSFSCCLRTSDRPNTGLFRIRASYDDGATWALNSSDFTFPGTGMTSLTSATLSLSCAFNDSTKVKIQVYKVDNVGPSTTANPAIRIDNVIITGLVSPSKYTVTGGGPYCSGTTGVNVGLDGSQTGVTYQLQLNGSNVGSTVAGTGTSLSFGAQTAAGTYTVIASKNGCSYPMTGSVDVSITTCATCPDFTNLIPNNVTVTSNSTCNTSNCTLSGGVITEAVNNCPTGSTLQYSTDNGTNWSTTVPVYDQDGPKQSIITRCLCDSNPAMSSAVSSVISTTPGVCSGCLNQITLVDPCVCNNDATVAGDDGTFSDHITVTQLPGQTITGSCANCSPSIITFTENPDGTYTSINFNHLDNVGYTATISANGKVIGTISNKCAYPNVSINAIGTQINCVGQPVIELGTSVTGDNGTGTYTWSGDGVTGSNFNPSGLPPGEAVVSLSYTGVIGGNVSPDNGITPAYPGCIQQDTAHILIEQPFVAPPILANSVIAVCEGESTKININTNKLAVTNTWDFETDILQQGVSSNTTIAENAPVQTTGSGVGNVSHIAAGSGCTSAMTTSTYDISNTSLADAFADNEYVEFCVGTSEAEYMFMGVNNVVWNHRRSDTGPSNWALVSASAPSVILLTGTVSTSCGSAGGSIPLNTGTCYRIYYWGATGSAGTLRIDELTITALYGSAFTYCWYLDNPDVNTNAEPVFIGECYDPGTTISTSPQTVYVVSKNASGCKSEVVAATVIVGSGRGGSLSCGNYNISVGNPCTAKEFLTNLINNYYDPTYFATIRTMGGVNIGQNANLKNYLGQELIYEVSNGCTGNKCWGKVVFEDKQPPVIEKLSKITIECADIRDYITTDIKSDFLLRKPIVYDNCCLNDSSVVIKNLTNGCGGIIIRTWTYTDCSNNSSSMTDTLMVVSLNPSRIKCPLPEVVMNCGEGYTPAEIYTTIRSRTSGGAIRRDTIALKNAYPYVSLPNGRAMFNPLISGTTNLQGGRLDKFCSFIMTYSDNIVDICNVGCSGNKKIFRKWTIIDWCTGGFSTCQQLILVMDQIAPKVNIADFEVNTNPWQCQATFEFKTDTLSDNCDIKPTFEVISQSENIQLTNSNNRWFATLSCGKYTFEYRAVDCCGNKSEIKYVVVNVADKTAPVPVVKRDIVVSLTSGGYDQAGNLQPASAKLFVESVDNGSHDNCTPVFMEIRRTKSPGSCNNLGAGDYNNNLTFRDLPCANPTKKIKSTDANGHIIYDYIGCTRAVPAGWTFDSWVPSTRFPGEYDCKDTDGGQWVKFCCADLEKIEVDANADGKVDALDKGYVEVQFRVWDDANKDGVYDCLDNYNDSWAFVKVECKLPPVITPPADATVYCDWPIETSTVWKKVKDADFSKTGKPWAYGPCGVLNDEVEFKDSEDFNKCGVGHIERQFRVTNWGITVYSRQHITVEGRKSDWSFYNDWPNKPCAAYYHDIKPDNYKYGEEYDTYTKNPTRINLAKEIGETTCDGPSDADIAACTPLYQAGPCDVIGINIKKWNFDFESGECRKWVVDYHFVNWCDHNEVIYRKIWTYNDETPPVMTKEDICIPAGTGTTTRCLTQLSHSKVATDNGCTSASTWIKWQVFLDINNDGVDDYLYSSFVPPHYNFGSDHIEKNLRTKYLAPTASGAKATITSPTNIDGPWSTHKITWKATDGCHNYAVIVDIVEVKDKKAPTPYCVPLSTALMAIPAGSPAGTLPMVEIWARDFDKGAGDNCYANGELYFTFFGWTKSLFTGDATGLHRNRDHFFDANGFVANASNGAARARYLKGELQLWRAADRQSAYLFTKVGDHNVRVDVTDPHQNSDWCMTTLKVICNNPTCPTSAGSRIAGTVKTASDQPVSNVTVTIDADITEYPVSVTTPATGAYEKEVPQGLDYSVTASKGGDYINGVSTMDLVMIQRHILGIQALDSPYKLIAADANNDGRVTAQDLTELRKLILGITNELSSNASWRFPVSAQTMNASNPFPFVEKIAISKMEADMTNQNFVAVKVGDVNGSVSNATVEARSNNNVVLAVAERAVEAGEVVEIPVSASNFADIAGFQYTMNVKGASVVSVNGGLLDITASNVGLISKDVMTMSYASTQGVTASENEVLFTLVVKAERAMKVSEMLAVSSTVTAAESYTSDLKVGKVSLDVRTAPVKAIELSQNEPNPFKGQTSISFMMPEAATATLSVYDVTGKVVTVRNINANKGMNSETFTREQLGASGVMYYTLKSGDFSATKKMFIVE